MPESYNVTVNENNVYTFTTSQNLQYFCAFSDVTTALDPVLGIYDIEVYTFDFYPMPSDPKLRKTDDRVSATIKGLLKGFFNNRNLVMIYVCDITDSRGAQRNELFKKWYRESGNEYLCDNLQVEVPDIGIHYGSVIRHMEFPHENVLKHQVIDKASGLMAMKYGN